MYGTDDAARRLEFVWLGPPDFEMPFTARGHAWVAAVVLCPVLVVLACAAARPVVALFAGGPVGVLVTGMIGLVAGTSGGVLLIRRVGQAVAPTRPLRHVLAVLASEVDAPRVSPAVTRELAPTDGVWLPDRGRATHHIIVPTIKD